MVSILEMRTADEGNAKAKSDRGLITFRKTPQPLNTLKREENYGAPGATRTPDLWFRRPAQNLYVVGSLGT
jgi:hypothetical protein